MTKKPKPITPSTFTEKDFAKMQFNVYGLPLWDKAVNRYKPLAIYPELSRADHIEFVVDADNETTADVDRELCLRYLLYAYGNGSPFMEILDHSQRKQLAAEYAGITPKEISNCREIVDILVHNRHPEVMKMAVCLFEVLNKRKHELWLSGQDAFHSLMSKVREPIDESKLTDDKIITTYSLKTKCFNDAMSMDNTLSQLEADLFHAKGDLFEAVNQERITVKTKTKMEQLAKLDKQQDDNG